MSGIFNQKILAPIKPRHLGHLSAAHIDYLKAQHIWGQQLGRFSRWKTHGKNKAIVTVRNELISSHK